MELAEDFRLVECGHALGYGHVLVRGAGCRGAGSPERGRVHKRAFLLPTELGLVDFGATDRLLLLLVL